MEVIPAVDVLDGRVVRLLRGDYSDGTRYGDDPVAELRRWGELGARLVHVVDLAGARSGEPDRTMWESLAEVGVPFQIGGGIRDAAAAAAAIETGARRAVMGPTAVWHPEMLATAVDRIGPDRLVAALDVRQGRARGAGWLDEGRRLEEVIHAVAGAGVATVLVTGIERDGTMEGPDVTVLDEVASLAPQLELLASGGVGSLDDLAMLVPTGASGVIVGRALYEGRFDYAEAVAHVERVRSG